MLKDSQKIKENLRDRVGDDKDYPEQATYNLSETKEEMLKDSKRAGIMFDQDLDADVRSLRQTIVYGLKGISAYGHQARCLDYYDDQVDNFYFRGLECTTNDNLSV
jgi:hydroxylamine reductase